MSERPPLPPGPYLVVGLARSGIAAALALRGRGEEVLGCDSGDPDVARLRTAGVQVELGVPGTELVERAGSVIKSPGVPAEAPAIAAARERGLPVIGELELAWRMLRNPFVAVTGTNGKTTTVELLGHVYREAAQPVAVAGNVGTAVASLAAGAGLHPDATIICEASSFQLEDTEHFAPEVAVLLNLAEDHLDRHFTWEAYVEAKLQAFRRQGNDDVAVLPDDLELDDAGGCARRVCFGSGPEAELAHRAGQLWWDSRPLMRAEEIGLRGPHNLQNAMAAAAVALARGLEPEAVAEGLRSFRGVRHRLEEVDRRDGILYVNDSKATNVSSTLVALRSFDGPIQLILGGRAKGGGFDALREPVGEMCRGVHLIGEATDAIAAALDGIPTPIHRSGDLEGALASARAAARPGEVILLSPACASFDQYPDFEARGDHFRALVEGG